MHTTGIHSPDDLLIDQMRDLFSVASQTALTFPELAASAPNESLGMLFLRFGKSCLVHKDRLKQCCELLGGSAEGDISQAMRGLIQGGNDHIRLAEGEFVKGLILVAHVHRILHYQIAGYGFATALASRIGHPAVSTLLNGILQEHVSGIHELSEVAMSFLGRIPDAVSVA